MKLIETSGEDDLNLHFFFFKPSPQFNIRWYKQSVCYLRPPSLYGIIVLICWDHPCSAYWVRYKWFSCFARILKSLFSCCNSSKLLKFRCLHSLFIAIKFLARGLILWNIFIRIEKEIQQTLKEEIQRKWRFSWVFAFVFDICQIKFRQNFFL